MPPVARTYSYSWVGEAYTVNGFRRFQAFIRVRLDRTVGYSLDGFREDLSRSDAAQLLKTARRSPGYGLRRLKGQKS